MIAVIAFTQSGCELGSRLAHSLGGTLWTTERLSVLLGLPSCGSLQVWTGERFRDSEALIFVSATGIAVRAIAPCIKDKFSDPAVVSVDEAGRFAVPLLSGHVGGANDLARQIADLTGGQAVVSTATDVRGKFAVDVWARMQNLVITSRELAKAVSAALLENQNVGISSAYPIAGEIPKAWRRGKERSESVWGPPWQSSPSSKRCTWSPGRLLWELAAEGGRPRSAWRRRWQNS